MAKDRTEEIGELMKDPKHIRNIAIAAHIDHGKTTLADSLVAGAGMMSEQLAGTQLFTDFDKQEQERGITIFAANVSMVHDIETTDAKGISHPETYLINLIDTPGHVDEVDEISFRMAD